MPEKGPGRVLRLHGCDQSVAATAQYTTVDERYALQRRSMS